MKKLLLTATLLGGFALSAMGQLALDDVMLLRHQRAEQQGLRSAASPLRAAPARSGSAHCSLAFIKLADGATADDLEAMGVHVSRVRGDIALVSIPTDIVEEVAASASVQRLELSRVRNIQMSNARAAAGVNACHEGLEVDHPYTGAGVICGIYDSGLDANHINFRNEDGTSRFGYLGHLYIDYSSPDGWSGDQYDRDNIWRFTTDNDETFHASHTAGILAGGYKGSIQAGVAINDREAPVQVIDNPYYGVAYGADIAATVGDTFDMLIAEGVDRILDYRYYMQKPCVISLSLGSNTGIHSSKAIFNQFLDLAAQEATIVISAGNEGDIPLSLIKTLGEDDTECKSFILPTYQGNLRYGQTYFYSTEPFQLQGVVYNLNRGKVSDRMPILENQQQDAAVYYCDPASKESDTDIVSANFGTAFKGYCGVGWTIDPTTGLYKATMDYYTVNNETTNADGHYILGFIVTGQPGQVIECYDMGIYGCLDDYKQDGWDTGSTDQTISDMACGENVIVVGSYNVADSYPSIDGFVYNYQGAFTPGKVSGFSSYGVVEGRSLPHFCAPGATIVSSTNQYYVENPEMAVGENAISAVWAEESRRNYWQNAMGTSMATPFAAGSIALWLEANPDLTAEECRDIAILTCDVDADVQAGNPAKWGAGKFNAYAGLKEAIRRAGVTDVTIDNQSPLMISTADHRSFELFVGNAREVEARVYNVAGQQVAFDRASGDQLNLNLSHLATGVYVVNVNGNLSRRIIVK